MLNPNPLHGVEPLLPAYGRDYKSLREAQADLDAGRDFATPGHGYIGRQELLRMGVVKIRVRYRKLTQTGFLTINPSVNLSK